MRTVVFVDLDGTIMRGPFSSFVFPSVNGELATKTGLSAEEIGRLVIRENLDRQADPFMPAVLAMDWDDIMRTVASRLGVRLEASALEIVHSHAGPPHAAILDGADQALRRLASPDRAIVAATMGLRKYQLPVLDALGLTPLFADVLTPDSHQALKTDRAFFGPWPEWADLAVMVGDYYAHDVLPSHGFGFRTVWKLNAAGPALQDVDPFARPAAYRYEAQQPVRPDAIITSMHELPEAVERLETGYHGAQDYLDREDTGRP